MLQFGVLGPLIVRRDAATIAIPAGRARILLGALLLNVGHAVAMDELIATIWGDSPPRTAATALHGHASRLRHILGEDALRTTHGGYRLDAPLGHVDAGQFRALIGTALAESSAEARSVGLRDALSLWRGRAFADFAYEPFFQPEIVALEELRLTAHEEAIDGDLVTGRQSVVAGELQQLVRLHPWRERLWGQLMLALYLDGRQADALTVYRDVRERMVEELGVEPGPELRELESAILRQEIRPTSRPSGPAWPRGTAGQLVRGSDRDDPEFVGRQAELDRLEAVLSEVDRTHASCLVTVIGEPGLGKSRLANRFGERVRDRVLVLTGQCKPDIGATYEPLHQILAQLPVDAAASPAVARLRHALSGNELLPGRMTEAAASRLFASLAQRRPVLIVIEDIHWAQPALLDLVDSMSADAGAAVLTVCLARPELADVHPSFGKRVPGACTIVLGRLSTQELTQVVRGVAEPGMSSDAVGEIVSVAEGNPLFAVQLAAWSEESAGSGRTAPPALRALLARRLDGLGPGELAVIQSAAIAGRSFTVEAVTALLPEEARPTVERHLVALQHRQIVRAGTDGLTFRHDLIHRTAYLTMDTATRAHLHERYANWLSSDGQPDPASANELIGYHLEQAFDIGAGSGAEYEQRAVLGGRAAQYLLTAGRGATARMDMPGAAALLTRALRLLPDDDRQRPSIMLEALRPLRTTGHIQQAMTIALDAIDLARRADDVVVEWRARLDLAFMRQFLAGDRVADGARRVAEEAIAALEPLGDHHGLAAAWVIIGEADLTSGDLGQAGVALRPARYHARRSPWWPNGGQIAWCLAEVLLRGPTPVTEVIRRCRELVEWRGLEIAGVLTTLAEAHAFEANFQEARLVVSRSAEIFRDWGHRRGPIYVAYTRGRIELLAADPVAAEEHGRNGLELGARVGGDETDGANALILAQALCQQRRYDEADAVAATYSGATSALDIGRAAAWNGVRAEIRIHRGDWAGAVGFAQQAVTAVDHTELCDLRADLRLPLAVAQRGDGDEAGAARTRAEALSLYAAKGNRAGSARLRTLLP
jgi:DNA-binding SARP family transcriptional activator